METHYQKGFDRDGRAFTSESKRDTNWGLIIALIACGILVIAFAINIAKNYYEDKFQNEKEKLEMTKKSNQTPNVIVKQAPVQQPQQPQQPIIVMAGPDQQSTVTPAVTEKTGKNEEGDALEALLKIIKATKKISE
ncbi:MAG TPA: hypothetical protein PLE28_01450 [bacterium]|nr:hypothetical protein [bacterium]